MAVDEARRLALHDAARSTWNAEAALALMEMLPPSGWGDVATRHQLDALEERTALRFDAVDERMKAMESRLRSDLRAELADHSRRTIQWNVATMVALAGIVVAAVGLVPHFG